MKKTTFLLIVLAVVAICMAIKAQTNVPVPAPLGPPSPTAAIQTVAQSLNPKISNEVITAWIALLGIVVRWLHLEAKTIAAVGRWLEAKFIAICQFTVAHGGLVPMYFRLLGVTGSPNGEIAAVFAPPAMVAAVVIYLLCRP